MRHVARSHSMLGSPALTAGLVALPLSAAIASRAAAAPIVSAADPALRGAVVASAGRHVTLATRVR